MFGPAARAARAQVYNTLKTLHLPLVSITFNFYVNNIKRYKQPFPRGVCDY